MALINCPECGAQVSDRAATCPQCGHPILKPAPHKDGIGKQVMNVSWMAIVIAMAIFGMFALLDSCHWRPV